jgi:hypothetical protein
MNPVASAAKCLPGGASACCLQQDSMPQKRHRRHLCQSLHKTCTVPPAQVGDGGSNVAKAGVAVPPVPTQCMLHPTQRAPAQHQSACTQIAKRARPRLASAPGGFCSHSSWSEQHMQRLMKPAHETRPC